MISQNYEKHPDSHKSGGVNINEKNSGAGSLITDMFKQVGKKMLEGNLKDMLKMSRPAKITSPSTHLTCFTNDFRFTSLINKAAEQTDPVERMKYLTVFLLSGLNCNPIMCKSKAPLNPILGETHQAKKSDGTVIYLEQTCHHPPTSNYQMVGPDKSYEMFGFAVVNAHITGMNSLKGWREGKNILKFKDGSLITFTVPETRINGLLMGDRILSYAGSLIIKDFTNKIESITSFAYKVLFYIIQDSGNLETIKNSITSIFSKNSDTPTDHLSIQISKVNPTTKTKELVSEGHGSWIGQIYVDGKRLWSYDDEWASWNQEELNLIPSDSTNRNDLTSIISGDYSNAQKFKDEYENLQRNDKKLREVNKK